MADKKSAAARINTVIERLEALEAQVEDAHGDDDGNSRGSGTMQYCAVPPVERPVHGADVSVERASAIWAVNRAWVNGTNLHYYLFDTGPFFGARNQQDVVRHAFAVWKDLGIGLDFTEVDAIDDAEFRIGFLRRNGSWSTVGRDALRIGQSERTMNFGWSLTGRRPMGQIGISGRRGAKGDVCASAERHNAHEKPSWPTEGRVPAAPDVVARLARCTHITRRRAPSQGLRERGQTESN